MSTTGIVLQRLTPQGQNLAALGPGWGAVPLQDVLPAIYGTRRDNRGFEGIAISPDGNTLDAIVQNPLATPCSGTDPISGETFQGNNNRSATRIVKIDITQASQSVLSGDLEGIVGKLGRHALPAPTVRSPPG
ncbi:MAG: esterase-like activity of phytase family protein [Burkholderiales bacterium]